jgi:hypothetical protein
VSGRDAARPGSGRRERQKEVRSMKHRDTPPRDLALLTVAVVLMLGGAVTLIADWLSTGIAIPLVAIGLALVVIARRDSQHQHAEHVPSS